MKKKNTDRLRRILERDIKALDWDFSHAKHAGIQKVAYNALILKRARLSGLDK